MQQFQFDMGMFEAHFKPWLRKELEGHAESVVRELLEEFRERLTKVAFEATAQLAITLSERPDTFAREIKVTFSPKTHED